MLSTTPWEIAVCPLLRQENKLRASAGMLREFYTNAARKQTKHFLALLRQSKTAFLENVREITCSNTAGMSK